LLLALGLTAPASATPPADKSAKPAADKSAKPAADKPTTAPAGFEAEFRAWQAERQARLTADDGWLTLTGMHWLKEGDHTFGSAKDNALVFPASVPARAGTFTRKGDTVSLSLQPGVSATLDGKPFTGGALRSDAEGKPDTLELGTLRLIVIRRGERVGVRVRDLEAPARKAFKDLPTYPFNAAWRVEARFEPTAQRMLSVPNVAGGVESIPSTGAAVFTVGGQEYRLVTVLGPGPTQVSVIFGDLTNRDETYGAGRFLETDMPKDGKLVLDFNRAYNPPCAFSPFVICPLPPPENKLKVRIEAGEKRYGSH
jgi:uncharacterized protein (DUF1684 family)